ATSPPGDRAAHGSPPGNFAAGRPGGARVPVAGDEASPGADAAAVTGGVPGRYEGWPPPAHSERRSVAAANAAAATDRGGTWAGRRRPIASEAGAAQPGRTVA